ncbi:uncharacterized protein LOC106058024 isoform X3 [Biomphalaria glabrata]|uniref:Uncharacterized protein LOC106058024 isoform X3 n=1 Tax=Biomphalaria glabrata TaxID=6526 RepID=A0A9W3ADT0_BIOGL|nr:uncharacterized protein LOC106058024 isoform X3 [Biomphalaria glabrata]
MEGDFKQHSDPVFQGASNADVSLETSCQPQPQLDVKGTLSSDGEIIDLKLEDAIGKNDEGADGINRRSKGHSENLEAVLDDALLPETFWATKDATAMSNTALMGKKVCFEDFSQTETPKRGHREKKNDYMSTILNEENAQEGSVLHQSSAQTLQDFHYQTSPFRNNGRKQVTTKSNDHQVELMYESNGNERECKKGEVPGESRVIKEGSEVEGALEKNDLFEEWEIKAPGSRIPFVMPPMYGFCQGGNCTQRVNCLSQHPDVNDEANYQMIEIPEFKPSRIRSRIEIPGQRPEHGRGYYQTIWPTNSPPCDAHLLDKSLELPPVLLSHRYTPQIDKHTPAVEEQLDQESPEFRKKPKSTIPDTKRQERKTHTKIVYQLPGSEEEYSNIKFCRHKMTKDGIQVQPMKKETTIQDSVDGLLSAVEGQLPLVYHESLEFRQQPKRSGVANEFFGDPQAAARLFIGPATSNPRLSNFTNLYESDSVYEIESGFLTHECHGESLDDPELDDIISQYNENEFLLTMKWAKPADSDLFPFPFHGINNDFGKETDEMNLGLLEGGLEHTSTTPAQRNTKIKDLNALPLELTKENI